MIIQAHQPTPNRSCHINCAATSVICDKTRKKIGKIVGSFYWHGWQEANRLAIDKQARLFFIDTPDGTLSLSYEDVKKNPVKVAFDAVYVVLPLKGFENHADFRLPAANSIFFQKFHSLVQENALQ